MIESFTNVVVGVVVAFVSQLVIFWFMGIEVSVSANLAMTGYFTLISLIRSYALRRFFNRLASKGIDK
jgi:hypothetical protein